MHEERKRAALSKWRHLLAHPEIRMSVEDHYDDLLKMADEILDRGIISPLEWRQMVRDAGALFAQSNEGLEKGV